MKTIYLPKKIREELKNASIGEKFYYTTRDGFIHEIQKLSDGFSSRTLNPSRKGLARVINITPPKPFKNWESYHKSQRKELKFKNQELETAKEDFVQFKWLQKKMGSIKRLHGVDCSDCGNLVRIKEKFEGYGWIETRQYCKFKVFTEIQPTHLTLQNAIVDMKQYHNDKMNLPNVMAELKKKHKNGNFKPGVWVATINKQVLVSVTREYAYEDFKRLLKREPTPEQVTNHKRFCAKFLQEEIVRSKQCKFYDGSRKPKVKYVRLPKTTTEG